MGTNVIDINSKKSLLSTPEVRAFRERFIQAIRTEPFPLLAFFGGGGLITWFRKNMSDADYIFFSNLEENVGSEPESVNWLMTAFVEGGMAKMDKEGNITDVAVD